MSKGLEALSYLDGIIANSNITINVLKTLEATKTIKQDLERLEKLEKVVEILKDTIDFNIFSREVKKGDGVEKTYFIIFGEIWIKINKEEYDLLKEVFGGEN